MEFFDCNVIYGMDRQNKEMLPVLNIEALEKHVARSGISRAIVWRWEQHTGSALVANQMVAEDIRPRENLFGVWTILPAHTHELPDPTAMPALMKANRIVGWRIFPKWHRYMPRAISLREYLEVAVARKIPLFINTSHGMTLEDLLLVLEKYPELTVVLTHATDWPSDRATRPIVKEFPNVYLDLTYCITDGGIESFYDEYGSRQLVYGSGFPKCYFGGMMMMVKHAGIPEADRAAIAGGNLDRILEKTHLD